MHLRSDDSAATLVVSDIHGCFDELSVLIEIAEMGPHDSLVAVGDLVDRGPKSREVVEFFAADRVHRRAVRGNHEHKHLMSRGQAIPSKAGNIVRKQTTDKQYAGMLQYFETMPFWIDLPDALIVHAGLQPGVPLIEQEPKVLMGVGSSGRAGFDGKSPWWFDSPDLTQPKPIVFGHEKHPEGVVRGARGNVFGIDTGAALGGHLTGLLLPEFRLISVATPNYWAQQLQEWLPKLKAEALDVMPWEELLAIDPATSAWSQETLDELVQAQEAYHWLVKTIEQRRQTLLDDSGYLQMDGTKKGEIQQRWRAAASTALDRWVLNSLPNRDVHELVRSRVNNWLSLRSLRPLVHRFGCH